MEFFAFCHSTAGGEHAEVEAGTPELKPPLTHQERTRFVALDMTRMIAHPYRTQVLVSGRVFEQAAVGLVHRQLQELAVLQKPLGGVHHGREGNGVGQSENGTVHLRPLFTDEWVGVGQPATTGEAAAFAVGLA